MSTSRIGLVCVLAGVLGASPACSKHITAPSPPTALAVTSISPAAGAAGEAASVSIFGRGFSQGTTVSIGGPATNVTINGEGFLTAKTPVSGAGVVDVVVTNPSGESARLDRAFTFLPFDVTSASPRNGLGGDALRVQGTAFQLGTRVTMDGVPAQVAQQTAALLTVILPTHPPGPVDIVVTTPGGQSKTLAGYFTYEEVTMSVSATTVVSGSPVSVSWTAPAGRSAFDWVGIFGVGTPSQSYTLYDYTNGKTSGTFGVTAPATPGQYEFRYLVDDGFIDVARSTPFTVTATAAAGSAATASVTGRSAGSPSFPPGRGRGR